ncbi:hypothetical protein CAUPRSCDRAFT_11912 [Caulochytrium protostelioides]|uniref:Uncharacterized protein n=1 Tax=Caulochytrium protostelioides TaxID=1555241 RepID=A0A4V1ITA7_9FUNG|nr:hypothetical protein CAUPRSCDRAFT_11912 [Caulochytrium protostelioides]
MHRTTQLTRTPCPSPGRQATAHQPRRVPPDSGRPRRPPPRRQPCRRVALPPLSPPPRAALASPAAGASYTGAATETEAEAGADSADPPSPAPAPYPPRWPGDRPGCWGWLAALSPLVPYEQRYVAMRYRGSRLRMTRPLAARYVAVEEALARYAAAQAATAPPAAGATTPSGASRDAPLWQQALHAVRIFVALRHRLCTIHTILERDGYNTFLQKTAFTRMKTHLADVDAVLASLGDAASASASAVSPGAAAASPAGRPGHDGFPARMGLAAAGPLLGARAATTPAHNAVIPALESYVRTEIVVLRGAILAEEGLQTYHLPSTVLNLYLAHHALAQYRQNLTRAERPATATATASPAAAAVPPPPPPSTTAAAAASSSSSSSSRPAAAPFFPLAASARHAALPPVVAFYERFIETAHFKAGFYFDHIFAQRLAVFHAEPGSETALSESLLVAKTCLDPVLHPRPATVTATATTALMPPAATAPATAAPAPAPAPAPASSAGPAATAKADAAASEAPAAAPEVPAPFNVSLIYLVNEHDAFSKGGMMPYGEAQRPLQGLERYPAIYSVPGAAPTAHWPNIVSLLIHSVRLETHAATGRMEGIVHFYDPLVHCTYVLCQVDLKIVFVAIYAGPLAALPPVLVSTIESLWSTMTYSRLFANRAAAADAAAAAATAPPSASPTSPSLVGHR